MLSRNDIRIAAALTISMVIHGMALMWNYGVTQRPMASPLKQKLTFQLTTRRTPEPVKQVKETKVVVPQEIREEKPEKQPIVQKKEPSVISTPVQPQPEPVAPAVEEVLPVMQEPVAQQINSEGAPVVALEDTPVPVVKGSEQDKPEVIMATPLYRQNPPPDYPKKARRRRLEGTVVLEVQVSSEGRVDDLQVKESSGHRILDRAAISSVQKWLFEPGRRNGLRVAMTVLVPVRFALQ